MKHPEELLAGCVDGSLSDEERGAVETHLAACDTCREEVELARRAVAALGSLEDEPVPFGVMNPVTAEIGRRNGERRYPRRARIRWAAGLAAAAAIVALLAIELPRMLGGGAGGSAAMSTSSEGTLGRGPAAEFAGNVGLEVRSVDYDVEKLEALATAVAAQAKTGATSAAAPPTAALDAAQTALDCLLRGSSTTANDRLVRSIAARFQGTPAYLGVFLESPEAGQPPDEIVIWVVSRKDCSILSFSSKRLS